jgi:hypothetical protein
MSFHLPIYAHASITDLATRDEGFIDSCPSSSGSSFVSSGISLDQSGGSKHYSSMSRLCSDDSIEICLGVCFCTTLWIGGIFVSMPICSETFKATAFDLYDGIFFF